MIFGGKQFTIISLARFNNGHINLDQLFEAITCDDWLHSGVWINYNELGLLTAHNVVQVKPIILYIFNSNDKKSTGDGTLIMHVAKNRESNISVVWHS